MPYCIAVDFREVAFDPYAAFQTPYELKVLKAFQKGHPLVRWRGTTPHNWFIDKDGQALMVRGDRETQAHLDVRDPFALISALTRICYKPDIVGGTIQHGPEAGKLFREEYCFDREKAKKAEREWARVKEAFAAREANPTPFAPQLAKLSEHALMLLRALKHEALYPFGKIVPWFAELEAQGLLQLNAKAWFELRPEAKSLRVPFGSRLKLVELPQF